MARILVVDDEPLISAMTEEWLSELGHVVVGPAHNLAAALKLVEMDMDAAIVDVSLGKDNSYPLAEALSARGVPFALATGYGRDGLTRGTAPFDAEQAHEFATFRRLVDQLLAESGSRASP